MRSRHTLLVLLAAALAALVGCQAMFTYSPLKGLQRPPSSMTPAQRLTYAQDALASGDTAAMTAAYQAIMNDPSADAQYTVAQLGILARPARSRERSAPRRRPQSDVEPPHSTKRQSLWSAVPRHRCRGFARPARSGERSAPRRRPQSGVKPPQAREGAAGVGASRATSPGGLCSQKKVPKKGCRE